MVVVGKVDVHPSHARFRAQMMKAAERVRTTNWSWIPLFFMIDKSGAELNAILQGTMVWPF
jgi:hypothetical protein